MDRGKIAEWLMALVMERAQATAVVGDLLEMSAAQSAGRFWFNVLCTWFTTVWADIKSEPRFIFGIAVLGAFVCWGVALGAQILFLYSGTIAKNWLLPRLSLHLGPSVLLGRMQMVVSAFAGSFYGGQWIVRYSLGREIAVCFAVALVGPVVFLVLGILLLVLAVPGYDFVEKMALTVQALKQADYQWFIIPTIPFFLGAGWARRQRQATQTA